MLKVNASNRKGFNPGFFFFLVSTDGTTAEFCAVLHCVIGSYWTANHLDFLLDEKEAAVRNKTGTISFTASPRSIIR